MELKHSTLKNYLDLAQSMRDAQKGFFASKGNQKEKMRFLTESKRLEKEFDQATTQLQILLDQ